MSLDWDSENCNPPLPQTPEEKQDRAMLIWASVACDLGSITEKSVDEWVFRLFYQKKVGLDHMYLADDFTPRDCEAVVRRWIGLVTNVTSIPRKKWLAKVTELMESRVKEELQYYKTPAEA